MAREPIRHHRSFQHLAMRRNVLRGISRRFHRLSPCDGQVAHALRTLPPVAAIVLLQRAAPRLACVKPAASVHPEPGSNSSLYISYITKLDLTIRFLKETDALVHFVLVLASLYFPSVFSMISLLYSEPSGPLFQTPFSIGVAKVETFFDSAKLF